MKTKHEKLIISLLAFGLVGASPLSAQSGDSFNTFPIVNDGLIGSVTINEDLDGDGNLDDVPEVDLDGDGRFDTFNEANIVEVGAGPVNPLTGLPTDLDINGDGVIQQVAYAQDLDGDGFTDTGAEVDIDGDGRFDLVSEDLDGDGFFDQIDEDVDGDGTLDLFAEDVNRNGALDTASRTYLTAVNPLTNELQDLDLIVANDVLINGEIVATENYVDAADDVVRAEFAAADANLQSQISKNREDIDANTRGIAMVAALQHTTVLPGMTNALDISAAHFEGETGMALNYARRINENVQINFGAASTTDFDESVIKAGVGIQW